MRAILCGELAVVDGLRAICRSFCATGGGLGAVVSGMLTLAGGPVTGSAVEVARRIISGFSLPVAESRGDVAILCREAGFPAADAAELVGSGILPVLSRLRSVFGRNAAVIDGSLAVVGSPCAPRVGHGPIVRVLPALAHRAIPSGSIQVARRFVARLGLAVAQAGSDVAILRGKACLPAADTGQLVDARVFAVLRGLGAIFGRDLAVLDRLGTIVRCAGSPRWVGAGLAGKLPFTCRSVPGAAIEVTGSVVSGRRLAVALLGLPVADVRREVAVAPFDVAVLRRIERVRIVVRTVVVLIYRRHTEASPSFI